MSAAEHVWLRCPLGGGVWVTITTPDLQRVRAKHIRRLVRVLGLVVSFFEESDAPKREPRVIVAGRPA